MNRSLFITIHLYLASFFAAAVLLVATSGGLYLSGYKGSSETVSVGALPKDAYALPESASVEDVQKILTAVGVEGFDFEYVRQSGGSGVAITRPTSRPYYRIDASGPSIEVSRILPNLQARMMELHMGHGPTSFKTFQKFFAVGMLFIILSGLWLGLSSARLRRNTGMAAGTGLAVFLLLVLL